MCACSVRSERESGERGAGPTAAVPQAPRSGTAAPCRQPSLHAGRGEGEGERGCGLWGLAGAVGGSLSLSIYSYSYTVELGRERVVGPEFNAVMNYNMRACSYILCTKGKRLSTAPLPTTGCARPAECGDSVRRLRLLLRPRPLREGDQPCRQSAPEASPRT